MRPRLSFKQILEWADAHRERTGEWPTGNSGPVLDAPGETWCGIGHVLDRGSRGLIRRSSIAQLLDEYRSVPNPRTPRWLSVEEILAWADAHYKRSGRWPSNNSGAVPETKRTSWQYINRALGFGLCGLPGGTTLSQLLAKHRGKRNPNATPRLAIKQILVWASKHRKRTGKWPHCKSGPVLDAPGETWSGIAQASSRASRGLRRRSTLGRLFAEKLGATNRWAHRSLSVETVLAWADACKKRTGKWPAKSSGTIAEADGLTWLQIERAFQVGMRGLPGGMSLAQLLAKHRPSSPCGRTPQRARTRIRRASSRSPSKRWPRLTLEQVLAWADAHHQRTGSWPKHRSGPIHDAPSERWAYIDHRLLVGGRGFEGGYSLARLLWDYRAVPNWKTKPKLNKKLVLQWAIRHHRETGKWPIHTSGPVRGAPGEKWSAIDGALGSGRRGLPWGTSLHRILIPFRRRTLPRKVPKVKKPTGRPRLTLKQILAWADAHHKRTSQWPKKSSGRVHEDPNEKWANIGDSLRRGSRRLKGGYSLAQLLSDRRGVPNPATKPRLYIKGIQEWAIQHQVETGTWPDSTSGPVRGARNENWHAINASLREGYRGLAGGSSVSKVLSRFRRRPRPRKVLEVKKPTGPPRLTFKQILSWADAHHKRTGQWPEKRSGRINEDPKEKWANINNSLRRGSRRLKGGYTLAQLLSDRRGVPNRARRPRLDIKGIQEWAIQHHVETGTWPDSASGPVRGTRNENWHTINASLRKGYRGLAGGSSLSKVLSRFRRPPRPHKAGRARNNKR